MDVPFWAVDVKKGYICSRTMIYLPLLFKYSFLYKLETFSSQDVLASGCAAVFAVVHPAHPASSLQEYNLRPQGFQMQENPAAF